MSGPIRVLMPVSRFSRSLCWVMIVRAASWTAGSADRCIAHVEVVISRRLVCCTMVSSTNPLRPSPTLTSAESVKLLYRRIVALV